ncbi:MAG: hypothetical protein IKM35_03710 [Bacteroidaceae bacterium]|nr:hypothetical protein [Bacteroidaceae bacterium]
MRIHGLTLEELSQLEARAAKGDREAQLDLADCLLMGHHFNQDAERAFEIYNTIYYNGVSVSTTCDHYDRVMDGLIYCYNNGIGVDKDESKAMRLSGEKNRSWNDLLDK